jgi:heat-inducible transcriptional repressor
MPESPPRTLSEREKTVLRYVVHDFIQTATPIGSRFVSKRHEDVLGLSSASIRNVMSDLEYMGYLNHPHTSAGRVPTDVGYRFYLDTLMEMERLTASEQKEIRENLEAGPDQDVVLRESSRLLSRISRQLSVVGAPDLNSGTLEKLELIQVSTSRLMVIISIRAGLVRTIMLEVSSETPREKLDEIARYLNERLGGLTLDQIRESFPDRVREAQDEQTGLIRLFIESVDRLFPAGRPDRLHIAGAETILDQPEFINPRDLRSIIELINNEEIIIHVLEKTEARPHEITVRIGNENEDEKLRAYSVITSSYSLGDVSGTIGVIGPTRMRYSRMIPLVDYVARTISDMFSQKTH